ncbi:MAG: phosphatase PAP2 family protein [Veillonellaceae bacterium]|nr:phosphatase PAP2 family protein [Veillonellaceae bacterium]
MKDPRNRQSTISSLHLAVRWVLGLAFILGLVAIFSDLVEDVWFREGFAWDAPIILAVHNLSRPWLDTAMRVLTNAGEAGAISMALLAAVWFYRKGRKLDAVSMLVSLGGATALNTLLKLLLRRPRPNLFPPLTLENSFSFPSGHVTASVAVFGFLAVLLWRSRRYGWAVCSAAWIPMVAFSRIYLGVHYPSDTLGALIFTSLWLMVVFAVHDRHTRSRKAIS